ncbi:MAG: VOC family protein [Marinoscillum sp.]
MNERLLYGIQQVGIGVTNILEAEKWYVRVLAANIKILEDRNPASHMAPYMGGDTRAKIAVILLNEHGGGGFELWQHTGRKPLIKKTPIVEGDLGINYIILHSSDINRTRQHLAKYQVPVTSHSGELRFKDPFGNQIHVKSIDSQHNFLFSGVKGCALGVRDLQASVEFYQKLGYQAVEDPSISSNQNHEMVQLVSSNHSKGRMDSFFGDSELILIKRNNGSAEKIYKDRYWGDPGFIHLCFDVYNLPDWVSFFNEENSPFTVLSNVDFKMGDAQGHWGYLEDPDGTLIEMVETHKIPIIKKMGLSIDLTNKSPQKPLPKLFIKALRLKKVHH